jgi:hypothetical protein
MEVHIAAPFPGSAVLAPGGELTGQLRTESRQRSTGKLLGIPEVSRRKSLVYRLLGGGHATIQNSEIFILYFLSSSASRWRQKGLPESAGKRLELGLAHF